MSEKTSTKEITKFARHPKVWGAEQIFFLLPVKWSWGHILAKEVQRGTPRTPRKSDFSD